MMLFECESVTAGYGARPVLHGVSLGIGSGEFVAIIGPNGAGKSTLIQTLAGNIRPMGGSVRFRGTQLHRYNQRLLSREFSVIHEFAEEPAPFTAAEFIEMGRFPFRGLFEYERDGDRGLVEWALDITGVTALRDRPINELSSGEKQLVNIARSLVQNSSLILMDEAVSHLDIHHTIRIMDILHRLNGDGSTVIMVIHDINYASDYATRIIGMKDGRIAFQGTPFDVMTYGNLEGLFDTPCIVITNPTSGRPFVYPVPGYIREGKQ